MTMDKEPAVITLKDANQIQLGFSRFKNHIVDQPEFKPFFDELIAHAGETIPVQTMVQIIRDRAYQIAAPLAPELASTVFVTGNNPLAKEAKRLGANIPDDSSLVEGLTQMTVIGLVSKHPLIKSLVQDPKQARLLRQKLYEPIAPGTYPSR